MKIFKELAIALIGIHSIYSYKIPFFNFNNNLTINRRLFLGSISYSFLSVNNIDKLREEAKRLDDIFNSQKKMINELPKLEIKPSKSLKPKRLIEIIMNRLKNSKDNQDEAMDILYDFLSNTNPFKKNKSKVLFNSLIRNTKYNIILGYFNDYELLKVQEDDNYAIYDIVIKTTFKNMLINGVPVENEKPEVIIRCLLSKTDDYWMIDGMFMKKN